MKRKPWDLRGQIEDLKDALAVEKKKADVVDDILMRLKVMSWLVTDTDVSILHLILQLETLASALLSWAQMQ